MTFHDAPFSPQTRTTATLSMAYLLLPPEIRCNIAGINWSCMIPHLLYHHRRKLPGTEGLFTASIPNAERARYETYLFSFLLIQVLRFCHAILCVFRFHPNYFPSRALNFFPWRVAFPSETFLLHPLMVTFTITVFGNPLRSIKLWFLASPFPLLVPASARLLLLETPDLSIAYY